MYQNVIDKNKHRAGNHSAEKRIHHEGAVLKLGMLTHLGMYLVGQQNTS